MPKKILLADDEQIIRTGISTLIPWHELDMDLVYCAENGQKAFEYLLKSDVDIVITDIRMPVMDGLELIRRCHEADIPARFILLTGYGEFEYAKSAMHYGVRHYLLKPTDETQIIQALLELSRSIDEDALRQRSLRSFLETAGDEGLLSAPGPQPDPIEKVKQIVKEELSNPDLSLKWIAHNKLYMNENYLSKLFLKKTGRKFSSYLTAQRMQRAKELIVQNPDIKMSELCSLTGFVNNPAYFSTSFKNFTGCTLTQYRLSLLLPRP